jgi:hypothetical protein
MLGIDVDTTAYSETFVTTYLSSAGFGSASFIGSAMALQ